MAFTDDFNRADENLETSSNWTRVDGAAGALQVVSNRLHQTSGTESLYTSPDTGSGDHYAQCEDWRSGFSWTGFLVVRATDANNWVGVRATGSGYEVYRKKAGSFFGPDVWSGANSNGDVCYLEASGSDIVVKINGTTRITVTDSFSSSVTTAGFICRGNIGQTADNFESDALGGGGGGGANAAYYRHQQAVAA